MVRVVAKLKTSNLKSRSARLKNSHKNHSTLSSGHRLDGPRICLVLVVGGSGGTYRHYPSTSMQLKRWCYVASSLVLFIELIPLRVTLV